MEIFIFNLVAGSDGNHTVVCLGFSFYGVLTSGNLGGLKQFYVVLVILWILEKLGGWNIVMGLNSMLLNKAGVIS